MLTDGSGNTQKSRVQNTLKIIRQSGAIASPVIGKFTDSEIYRIILKQDKIPLIHLMEEIISDIEAHGINALAGDALEGYNPTHDLCRYMINAISRVFSLSSGKEMPNFEFPLDGHPHQRPGRSTHEAMRIDLDDEDLERKYTAAHNYPELLEEVNKALELHGKLPFQAEYLWPVNRPDDFQGWTTDEPFYETWGKQKINSGKFKELITYHGHLRPLAELLMRHPENTRALHDKI